MKFKRILSLLAATAMTVTAITGAMTASASEVANGTCGDGITWTLDANGKLIISGEGKMDTPTLGSSGTAGDYSDIYTYKEKYKDDIKELVIEEGVTSIGFCAFYQMPNLVTVVLPSTISDFNGSDSRPNSTFPWDIRSQAFMECTSLKNLTLAEGMTCIGGYAFMGCTSLESVRIPSTIKDWGQKSFYQCSKLREITLPEGLTIMGAQAFSDTAVESVVIPSTITQWNEYQHRDRELPDLNASAGYAFGNCQNLSSVTLTEGLKSVNKGPFYNCPNLKKVVIPASVTNLNNGFACCSGLEEAYIEEGSQLNKGATERAFYYCEKLKRLEIPAGAELDWTGANWLDGSSSITDLYIHGQEYGYFPVGNNSSKVHCYSGTKTYNSLLKGGVIGIRLVDIEEDIENAKTELNKAVTEAQKYAEEDYTPESYSALKALLEKAGKYGEDSNVMSMEDTTEGIYAAIEGLRDKSEEPSSDPSSSDSSDSSNPTDNSSNPSNSSGNNNQSQSPNTPVTPSTSAPTTATPKPVTPPTVTTTVAKPAKVKAVKLKAKKKNLNVSWKKVSGATGYEVMYATNNKFTKNKKTVTVKKNKVTLKKLKPMKKYFVKVRAYKLANGRKYFGKWSKVVKKKTR